MDFKVFCENYCCYRHNEDKRNLEPCINCPVETYIDMTESNDGANKCNTI